jgi:catechol 2,3-dioxygenase-like lactoylglutathione lyase family enzyme
MECIRIKETCLYVYDLERTREFYHGMLGLPVISFLAGKHVFFRAGQSVLLCFNPEDSKLKQSPPPHYGGGKQHFAFEIKNEEYERVKDQIAGKGIPIIDEVTWPSGKKSFYFNDPEGNVLEILPEGGIWD